MNVTDVKKSEAVIPTVQNINEAQENKISVVADKVLKGAIKYTPRPLSAGRFSKRKSSGNFLARYISAYGVGGINGDRKVVKAHLKTEYEVKYGKPTNQKHSGRCWIFGTLNMMRVKVLKEYGDDFQYSQNFVAFWDKIERANFFLEKMVEMSDLDPMNQRVVNMVDNLFGDGGEWELFCNVVEKYGLVPDYAMPETDFSGNSGGYMDLIQSRLNEVGGVLHKMAGNNASPKEIQDVKNRALSEVYGVLTKYLGTPPKDFFWKTGKKKLERLTPVEFYKMNGSDLSQMVHLTHLPYRKEGSVFQVEDVGNVVEGMSMHGMNVSMDVIKDAIVGSIKEGNAVPVAAETKHLDKKRTLFSMASDIKDQIFNFDASIKLDKGDRLKYRATVVAHLMNIVGCDDPKELEKGLPEQYGRLWKVENSWKGLEEIYMTDSWFDEYVYGVIVDKKYLPKKLQNLWDNREEKIEQVPAWDPFGRI